MSESIRNVSAYIFSIFNPFACRMLIAIDTSDKPDVFAGAPIAVQLVGKHFKDEETVAAAELLSKIVQT